jgi:4a-hydroxytetrahydrobiopterin dehydratase
MVFVVLLWGNAGLSAAFWLAIKTYPEPLLSSTMWTEKDNKLTRSFQFKDFKEAFLFMTQVAEVAEAQNHHPWWSNVYNEVNIKLSTHDAGDTVTEKDHKLAAAIDLLYEKGDQA